MRLTLKPFARVSLALMALFPLCFLVACDSSWTGQAVNIINLLIPAIEAALGIVTVFGIGISPSVLTEVEKWQGEAVTALQTVVKPLIEQYSKAEAAAKPALLDEIAAALNVTMTNLASILTTLHVTDPNMQASIMRVFDAISSEIQALIALVPALQGKVTDHEKVKELVAKVKSAKEFKSEFNAAVDVFGRQYYI